MHFRHKVTLVVIAHIRYCEVSKILVDEGSSINILYGHALDRMEDTPELDQKSIPPNLITSLWIRRERGTFPGMVEFSVCADPFNVVTEFSILDVPFPYNAILRRSWIHMIRAVPSTHHQLLKYPTPFRMANKRGDQAMARTVLQ